MLRRLYDATWGRVFALGYDLFTESMERKGVDDMRRDLLSQAEGRCLEIGAGTGRNLEHWPAGVELVLSEPFPPMAAKLRHKLERSGRRAEVVVAPAEELPFPDDHFDTIAVTLVLCTVHDPQAALDEIARVLRPGGRFLFLEHVRAEDPRLAHWQDRLHGPWYAFGHGCHCNRDTGAYVEASPLSLEEAEHGDLPGAVALVRPMLRGSARARSRGGARAGARSAPRARSGAPRRWPAAAAQAAPSGPRAAGRRSPSAPPAARTGAPRAAASGPRRSPPAGCRARRARAACLH